MHDGIYEPCDVVEAQFGHEPRWRMFEVVGTQWDDGEQWLQLRSYPGRGFGMECRASVVRHPLTPPQED